MVIVFSNWSSDNLDWLQHGACSGSCNQSTTFSSFSNIRFVGKGETDSGAGSNNSTDDGNNGSNDNSTDNGNTEPDSAERLTVMASSMAALTALAAF